MKADMPTILSKPNSSFLVQTLNSEQIDVDRNQHIENELILFTYGSGITTIGDHKGRFHQGDIFFIGSNLMHSFKSDSKDATAVIVHFRNSCWGNYFINLPECSELKNLFELATYGLQLINKSKFHLQQLIEALIKLTGINRINILLHCLQIISSEKEYIQLSKKKASELQYNRSERIQKVIEFTLDAFNEPISLSQIAAIAYMSIPSFCNFFKQCTQKTYIDYLNEVRINHACRLLLETMKPVNEICYESGYNTVPHFHRQFLKLKNITPLQFRRTFSIEIQNQLNENTFCKRVA